MEDLHEIDVFIQNGTNDWTTILETTDAGFLKSLDAANAYHLRNGGIQYQVKTDPLLVPLNYPDSPTQRNKAFHKPPCAPIINEEEPNHQIAFITFQKEAIHCTSRFSLFFFVQKNWREQFMLKDQVLSNLDLT